MYSSFLIISIIPLDLIEYEINPVWANFGAQTACRAHLGGPHEPDPVAAAATKTESLFILWSLTVGLNWLTHLIHTEKKTQQLQLHHFEPTCGIGLNWFTPCHQRLSKSLAAHEPGCRPAWRIHTFMQGLHWIHSPSQSPPWSTCRWWQAHLWVAWIEPSRASP